MRKFGEFNMPHVTRPWVLTLRFERKFWKTLKYPFVRIIEFIKWLIYYINWCVVRSIIRMIGIPIMVYAFWSLMTLTNGISIEKLPIMGQVLAFMYILLIAVGSAFYIYVWVTIPDKELQILNGEEVIEVKGE
jgi:hypothetical protein